ncbi:MAG: ribulose-phosphate 3-epimerase [Erysipelotrichaceae bacterium]|nr:ribulose-phosphate 3-epimerase [Erysipelotrichaceae bacterium]
MKIATSILNANDRVKVINELNNSLTDYIHFDVMDGNFVSDYQLPVPELRNLIQISKKKNDVHLMVEHPLAYIDAIKDLPIEQIAVHVEIEDNLKEIFTLLKENNIKCSLAVDLDTDIKKVTPYLPFIDTILIMTVKAGKGGQVFSPSALEKMSFIPDNINIELDGGINNLTVKKLNGSRFPDILVSGSYILKDIENNIKVLKQEMI